MKKICVFIISVLCLPASAQTLQINKSEIAGKQIVVTTGNGEKVNYKVYGFCYSTGRPFEADFDKHLELLKGVHANSIRTYRPLAAYKSDGSIDYTKTRQMFDKLAAAGISLAVGFDLNQDLLTGVYKTYLEEVGSHPALLCVLLGNEYNYHYIGSAPAWADPWFTKESWLNNLKEAAKNSKERCNRFVGVVHGEVPTANELAEYKACGVDIVMPNIYRGNSFYDLFTQWTNITNDVMPLVVSEFGKSSVTASGSDASRTQADWIEQLWSEINTHICDNGAGGYVFELVDEAWKSGASDLIGSEKHLGVFTENGTYKPAADLLKGVWKDKADCGSPTSVIPINSTGLKVYPNPVGKGQTLRIETDTPSEAIEIYSLSGALIKRQPTGGTFAEINLSLPEGSYILKTEKETTKLIVR